MYEVKKKERQKGTFLVCVCTFKGLSFINVFRKFEFTINFIALDVYIPPTHIQNKFRKVFRVSWKWQFNHPSIQNGMWFWKFVFPLFRLLHNNFIFRFSLFRMRFFPAELNDIISSKMTNVQSKKKIVNKIANGKIRKVFPSLILARISPQPTWSLM